MLCGDQQIPTATATIRDTSKGDLETTMACTGTGPVDAAFKVINMTVITLIVPTFTVTTLTVLSSKPVYINPPVYISTHPINALYLYPISTHRID